MVFLLTLLLSACNALSPLEKQQYENLISRGAPPIMEKDPALAGLGNVLPGAGDIYTGEWGAFVLDLLFWPFSVAWAVPQGVQTAKNVNMKATVAYYSIGAGRDQGFDVNRSGPPPAKTD